jgi:hypothetical protein
VVLAAILALAQVGRWGVLAPGAPWWPWVVTCLWVLVTTSPLVAATLLVKTPQRAGRSRTVPRSTELLKRFAETHDISKAFRGMERIARDTTTKVRTRIAFADDHVDNVANNEAACTKLQLVPRNGQVHAYPYDSPVGRAYRAMKTAHAKVASTDAKLHDPSVMGAQHTRADAAATNARVKFESEAAKFDKKFAKKPPSSMEPAVREQAFQDAITHYRRLEREATDPVKIGEYHATINALSERNLVASGLTKRKWAQFVLPRAREWQRLWDQGLRPDSLPSPSTAEMKTIAMTGPIADRAAWRARVGQIGTWLHARWNVVAVAATLLVKRPQRVAWRARVGQVGAWLRARWNVIAVVGVAAAGGAAALYQIGYEPLWQDEAASIVAARSIRAHWGLPRLPSSLLYFKGELYHALIAVVGAITGDGIASLRAVSVGWYVATILAFGLVLVPTVAPSRRLLQVLTTVLFATAPQELVWARDVRMYQQMQFFAVVFFAFAYRALTRRRTSDIAIACASIVLMYLSHEESFILFPAIAVVFFYVLRLSWVRDRRWWILGGGVVLLIALQYELSKLHPPILGYDLSNRPYVQWDPSQFWFYYSKVYFGLSQGTLAVVSSLAVLATVVGIVQRSRARIYLALLLWVATLMLSTIFTARVARYAFVTLPLLFLLGGLGAADLLLGARRLFLGPGATPGATRAVRVVTAAAAVPAAILVVVSLSAGPRDYGLAAARLTGVTYIHRHLDYDLAARYVQTHERPGDLLITLSPADITAFYLHRRPDLIIQTGTNKLLYVTERGGRAVDTVLGVPLILNGDDLQNVLAQHRRAWLVTDQGSYLRGLPPDLPSVITKSFSPAWQGASTSVWRRTL